MSLPNRKKLQPVILEGSAYESYFTVCKPNLITDDGVLYVGRLLVNADRSEIVAFMLFILYRYRIVSEIRAGCIFWCLLSWVIAFVAGLDELINPLADNRHLGAQ